MAASKNLLLVEHDTETVSALYGLLHAEGYAVVHVTDGQKARQCFNSETNRIDLVIFDIDGEDGIGTAREILAVRALPLLILTSRTEKEDVQEIEGISSYGVVTKNSGDFVLLASIKMAFRLHESSKREQTKDDELKESEIRFRTAFENTAIGMSLTDFNGHLVKVNRAFAEMVGRTLEEMQEIDFAALTHPDDQAISKACLISLVKGETKVGRIVKRYLHTDGHIVWADLSIVVLRNGRGEPHLFISQIQDITEHKKAEDQLRQQEFWLRECQRVGRIGSYDLDIAADSWTSSEVLDDIFGIAHDSEKRVSSWHAIVHPDQSDEMMRYFITVVVGERKPFDKEYKIIRQSDGQERWVWGRGELHFGADGAPRRMIGTIQDVTERHHAESALKESEARFKEIFDKAPLGYHELDEEGRIVRVNSTEAAMLGYTREEIVGRFAWEFVANVEQSREGTLRKLRGEQYPGQGFERDFIKKDGTVMRALLDDALLHNPEGRIIGIRTALQDITEHKRLEEQLLQSQKLEGVGTLAGGIAHDFNNLLAMILGSAEMLYVHMPDTPSLKKYVDNIITASERGRSISRQLLIFSRPDHAELKPISLSHTITELHELLGHFLPKSIAIVKKIDVENGMIMGDSGQIHQAILNLAINAGDAMTNHGTLTISEYSVPAAYINAKFGTDSTTPYVAVSVSDTGIGMDARTLAKMFDPFFTTKERGKGTGLGLSIVHGIIKNHNGFIDVDSAVGKGTTFTLFFPALPSPNAEPVAWEDAPREQHSEKILVVDDEDMIRETLSEFLVFAGYTVYTASNGKDALKLFSEHHDSIDLVVTDLGMPEMSGEELFRKLRDIDRNAKVVVSSGYLDGTTKSELLGMGIKDVLTKPFKMQDIRDAIEKALN